VDRGEAGCKSAEAAMCVSYTNIAVFDSEGSEGGVPVKELARKRGSTASQTPVSISKRLKSLDQCFSREAICLRQASQEACLS
jgi:hypothetical protein